MISLFLIIGQISASDTDLIEINDSNIINESIESEFNDNAVSSDAIINENTVSSDAIINEEGNDSIASDNPESYELKNKDIIEIKEPDELEEDEIHMEINRKTKDTAGIVMANDNYSCGPASLATVLNKNGLNVSLNEISKHTNTNLEGTTMQSLIDSAKYYNISAYGVEIDTKSLRENFIVHLNINGCKHWTVITKVTDTHVFLADSTEGNINFTIDEFNSYFTGKAIVLSDYKNNSQDDLKEQIISNNIQILDKNQCLTISGKGLKKKVIGYKIVWKYGFKKKYGWVLRPKVVGGHVSFSQWEYVKGYYNVWGKYKIKEPIYKYYYVNDESLTSAKIKKAKK